MMMSAPPRKSKPTSTEDSTNDNVKGRNSSVSIKSDTVSTSPQDTGREAIPSTPNKVTDPHNGRQNRSRPSSKDGKKTIQDDSASKQKLGDNNVSGNSNVPSKPGSGEVNDMNANVVNTENGTVINGGGSESSVTGKTEGTGEMNAKSTLLNTATKEDVDTIKQKESADKVKEKEAIVTGETKSDNTSEETTHKDSNNDSTASENKSGDTETKPADTNAKDKAGSKGKEKPPDPFAEKYKRYKKLTNEEALEKMKWTIDQLRQLPKLDTSETKFALMLISGMYFDFKSLRPDLSECMLNNGFPALSMSMMRTFNQLGLFKNDLIWFPAYYVFNTWWNYSDTSYPFAEALAANDTVKLLTMNCDHKPFLESMDTSKNVFYVIKSSLSILHNIARTGTTKHVFDDNKTAEVLAPFLEHSDGMLKILANLTMAHIVDEDINKKQILGPETIEKIISWTGKALETKTKRMRGFTAFELIDGLAKLAVNDSNKMTIVDKGAIPVLQKMLESEDVQSQTSACALLWTLSFDKDVRLKIQETPEVMELLENLKTSEETRVKKNASGALWVIKGENDISAQARPSTAKPKHHIMLSYSWSDKEMVLTIKNRLQEAGYTVWIDVENMGGSTLEAMADAIEQASVVLMCMSEKYKNSPNCRTEAEYTFQLRKVYVPLMMQKKYKPDGWLGIMLGAKLFFDFSGKYPFEKPITGLLRELQSGQKDGPPQIAHTPTDQPDGAVQATSVPMTHAQPMKRHATTSSLRSDVISMGQADLSTWLQKHAHLSSCLTQFEKYKIDGKLLNQLVVMRSEAPEFFYQCLEKRLSMDLSDILQFTCALDEL